MLRPILVWIAFLYTLLHLFTSGYNTLPDSNGHTSTPYLLPNLSSPLICKSIHPHYADILLPIETEVYERFSSHDPPQSLLPYHGIHDKIPAGIILEFAELGNVQDWVLEAQVPTTEMLYKWTYQVAEALEFAHGLGVLHADIHCLNFFLTKDMNLKVGDWGGASIDGGKSHCSYRYSHRLFGLDGIDVPAEEGISKATEIFALGSAFYTMISGQGPWPELEEPRDRAEIRNRIVNRNFPDTKGLRVLGDVVLKCWGGLFESMTDVRRAIENERATHQKLRNTTRTFGGKGH